jgi:hypothetical protein
VTSSAALPPFAPRNMNPTASAAIPFVLLLAPHAAAASTSQRTRRRRRNKRGTVGAGREWEGWIAVATGCGGVEQRRRGKGLINTVPGGGVTHGRRINGGVGKAKA